MQRRKEIAEPIWLLLLKRYELFGRRLSARARFYVCCGIVHLVAIWRQSTRVHGASLLFSTYLVCWNSENVTTIFKYSLRPLVSRIETCAQTIITSSILWLYLFASTSMAPVDVTALTRVMAIFAALSISRALSCIEWNEKKTKKTDRRNRLCEWSTTQICVFVCIWQLC